MRTPTVSVLFLTLLLSACQPTSELPPPNILWITSEDNGPELGVYSDTYADTPNLDALASEGMIYRHAWSNAPVCAPARTTIISGMYPPSLGAQHMRSMVPMPEGKRMYPEYLREAGYYCTNNRKEDYNLEKPEGVWDESSDTAHWRNRPDSTQPFFAIFNFTTTHESQIRQRPHEPVHDPSLVSIPEYHPDRPEVRQDWAQYHDKMTEMDAQAGEVLRQLEEDGLSEHTIVFYYGDHGPGMPRSKRWTYNSGLHVPLIVFIPETYREFAPDGWQQGGASDRMVGFVDLAPTALSLAGIDPPAYMHGDAFLGTYAEAPREFNYGFRGRMDERYDMVRAVRDERYVYMRNYNPHKIYGQYVAYMFQTPTTQVWHDLYVAGELEPPKTYFWEAKPSEEFYDLQNDPDETINLADSPDHAEIIERFRRAEREWTAGIRDLGFLPEYEIHARSNGIAPYDMGREDDRFPAERIMSAARSAGDIENTTPGTLETLTEDEDSAVRYWGVLGFLMRGEEAIAGNAARLMEIMEKDPAPAVRIAAAEALGRFGPEGGLDSVLEVLLTYADAEQHGLYLAMQALNAIDHMDTRAASAKDAVSALPDRDPDAHGRMGNYVLRLKEKILMDLGGV